jgi:hypothetical protein
VAIASAQSSDSSGTGSSLAPRFDSRVFEGAGHNERAWAERLDAPRTLLLQC